jgi:hypothetical protein
LGLKEMDYINSIILKISKMKLVEITIIVASIFLMWLVFEKESFETEEEE